MADLRLVGHSVPRVDGIAKVTGRAEYTSDLVVPGMLHGKILRSQLPHARIRFIDTRRATKLPGTEAVLIGTDLADIDPYYGHVVRDRPLIAVGKVRFMGEPVAAVAARTEEIAEEALKLIEVDYEELQPILTIDQAMDSSAPMIHDPDERVDLTRDEGIRHSNICFHGHYAHGSVEEGFAHADEVFEDTFTFPMIYHYAMEPHTAIAYYGPGGITVWSSAQHPFLVRAELAAMFGEPLARVRLVVPYLGGGYGSKSYTKIEPLVVALARKAGRPVRIALSVAEAFQTVRRHSAVVRLRTGVKRDGAVVARTCTVLMDTGAYADNGPRVVGQATYRALGSYRCPHVRSDSYALYTNTAPAGSFRSVGGPQTTWAVESQMDMIAERLGIDPLALRLRHLIAKGELCRKGARPMDTDLGRGLRVVAQAIGWDNPAPPTVGRGLGLIAKDGGADPVATAIVRLHFDGSITVSTGSIELGQGVRTVLTQIAAEEMQVAMEQTSVVDSDTASNPYNRSTGASRSTTLVGLAVQEACRDLREQLLTSAAEALNVPINNLAVQEGRIKSEDGRCWEYTDVLRAFYEMPGGELVGRAYIGPRFQGGRLRSKPAFWEVGWGAAEIQVDEETGAIHLCRYVSAADAGKAINPVLAEGQDEGATFMGIGHTFFEAMHYEDGQLINDSLMDYRVPNMEDLPDDFSTILIEDENGPGPYGAKGMGESGVGPVAPAVANALARATGARIFELPLTPERVWRALQKLKTGPEDPGGNAK